MSEFWGNLYPRAYLRNGHTEYILHYHTLCVLFLRYGHFSGASGKLTTDLQFYAKMCYGKGASANLRMLARYAGKNGRSWKNKGASRKKFDQGCK